jgi:hypothetical protein
MEKNKLPEKIAITVSDDVFIAGNTLLAPFKKFTGRVGFTTIGNIEIGKELYKTRIYVFVSQVITKKIKTKERKSRISKSGKYKSIRHLIETLIKEDRNTTKEKVDKIVKQEYPTSSYITNPTGSHWSWYQTHIAHRGRFTIITAPPWARGLDDRMKNKMQKRKEEREDK